MYLYYSSILTSTIDLTFQYILQHRCWLLKVNSYGPFSKKLQVNVIIYRGENQRQGG